jgi:hypothetical protein
MEVTIDKEKGLEYFKHLIVFDEHEDFIIAINKETKMTEFSIITPKFETHEQKVEYVRMAISVLTLNYQMALIKGDNPFAQDDEDYWVYVPIDMLGGSGQCFKRKNFDQFNEMMEKFS